MRRVITSLKPILWATVVSFIFLAVAAGNALAASPLILAIVWISQALCRRSFRRFTQQG